MRPALLFFFLLGTNSFLLAQPSALGNTWYFGHQAGISFNGGAVRALTDGQTASPGACAAVSSPAGQLLFYTDGATVWNRTHQIMPGATNLGGVGRRPRTALIVPHPNRSWLYFVFSVSEGPQSDVQYALVDMTLHGNLGGTEYANKVLSTAVTEKITIVPHCNKSNYWLILHESGNSTFRVHLINDNGLVTTPRRYSVGSAYQSEQHQGNLKPSADGRKLAAAVSGPAASGVPGFVEVFDFNDKTGAIFNPVKRGSPDFGGACGVEFSPDGTLLYLSSRLQPTLHQLETATLSSRATFLLPTTDVGSLQAGPDGKVYVALPGEAYLGVINAPNQSGPGCGWVARGLSLNGKRAGAGLPFAFAQVPILPPGLSIARQDGRTCNEFRLTCQLTNLDPNHLIYEWYRNGRPVAGANQATYQPVRAGTYQLKVRETECLDRVLISNEVVVPILELDPTTRATACGTFQLAAHATAPVTWRGAGITPALAQQDSFLLVGPTGRQTYRVRTTSLIDPGCFLEKEVTVTFDVPAPFQLDSAHRTACGDRLAVLLTPTADWDELRWTAPDGSTGPGTILTATRSGTYPITARSRRTGCESRADLTVTLNPNPVIQLPGKEIQICFDQTPDLVLRAGLVSGETYEWMKEGTPVGSAPTLTVGAYGVYGLRVQSAQGCQTRDSIRVVSVCPPPKFILSLPDAFTPNGDGINDTFLVRGQSVGRFELCIVNRWGEVVYRHEGPALPEQGLASWDGTFGGSRVVPGTYAYQLKAYSPSFAEGQSFTRRGVVRVVW